MFDLWDEYVKATWQADLCHHVRIRQNWMPNKDSKLIVVWKSYIVEDFIPHYNIFATNIQLSHFLLSNGGQFPACTRVSAQQPQIPLPRNLGPEIHRHLPDKLPCTPYFSGGLRC